MYAIAILLFSASCAKVGAPVPPVAPTTAVDYAAIVASPDRTDADRALDLGRHPADMLAFFGVHPGEQVAELGAGGGYTTELLARAVTPGGVVYGHNTPEILEKFASAAWTARLARPACREVVGLTSPFESPFPGSVHDLDAVLIVLLYHDTVWMGVDRAKMNASVFAALKPGGIYGIVDHSAKPGDGLADVQTLHRIDEATVEQEVGAAGFKLDAEADFLRNPTDTRDWNDSPGAAGDKRGTSDRFVLRFKKP